MDELEALSIARRKFGCRTVTSTTSAGLKVIARSDEGHNIPIGYGLTWEDALIDSSRQEEMECAYA